MQQDVYGAAGRGRELLPAGQLPQQTNHPGHQACQVGIVFVIMHKIGLPIHPNCDNIAAIIESAPRVWNKPF